MKEIIKIINIEKMQQQKSAGARAGAYDRRKVIAEYRRLRMEYWELKRSSILESVQDRFLELQMKLDMLVVFDHHFDFRYGETLIGRIEIKGQDLFLDSNFYLKSLAGEFVLDAELDIPYTDDELKRMWLSLADLSFDPDTECIETPYILPDLTFPSGTHREEIWHYFDEKHSKGVARLFFDLEEKEEAL